MYARKRSQAVDLVTPEIEEQADVFPTLGWVRQRLAPGSVLATLWAAAAPVALELGLLRLYQLLDLYWLGHVSSSALAALTLGVGLRWAVSGLVMGLAAGGHNLMTQRLRAQDPAGAQRAAWQTLLLCAQSALLLAALGMVLTPSLLRLLGATGATLDLGIRYLLVTWLGLVPLTLVYTANNLWRGLGAGRQATLVLGVSTVLSLGLEPLLVFGWGALPALGIAGAALAVVAGQTAALLLQLSLVLRGRAPLALPRERITPLARPWRRIVRLGGPVGLQLALRAVARLTLLGLIAWSGSLVLAGYAVANGILMAVAAPASVLSSMAAALVRRNLNAARPRWALNSVWGIGVVDVVYMVGMLALAFAHAPALVRLFCREPEVVAYGADALRIVGLGYVASSLGGLLARSLDVSGRAVPATTINVLTLWGVQVPAVLILSRLLGATGLWLGLAAGGVAYGLLLSYRFRHGRWAAGARGQKRRT